VQCISEDAYTSSIGAITASTSRQKKNWDDSVGAIEDDDGPQRKLLLDAAVSLHPIA
jgi:hypothetical protein